MEITHEALLHAWPRLRDWIDEDRDDHLLRQRLEEDGRAWEDSRRDSSLLYRGSRLEQAHTWAKSPGTAGSRTRRPGARRTFLTRARWSSWPPRPAAPDDGPDPAECCGAGRPALVAVGSAVVAWQQRNDAVFEQVLAEADRVQDSDPSLAAQLDLVAHDLRPDDEGTNNRLVCDRQRAAGHPARSATVPAPSTSPRSARTASTLATASYDRTVRLWDVADPPDPRPWASRSPGTRAG